MTSKATIYLDGAASTPVAPRVIERLTEAYRTLFGNPSSSHGDGAAARSALEHSRRVVAEYFRVSPREICFTSGATESNNLAIAGVARFRKKGHIVTIATEHPSVLAPIRALMKEGYEASFLPVATDGSLDLNLLADNLRPDTFLISAMMVNNETGVVHPVQEIARLARERGILFHCDATQAVRNLRLEPKALGIHLLSASGHKIYGPKGVGLLYVDREITESHAGILPLLYGGKQEHGVRAGTENVPSACGLAEAFTLLSETLEEDQIETTKKRNAFLERISELRVTVNGQLARSVPSILNLHFENVDTIAMMRALDHLRMSAGSACSGGMPSHVLTAMGKPTKHVSQSLRFCFGRETTLQLVRQAATEITEYVKRVS